MLGAMMCAFGCTTQTISSDGRPLPPKPRAVTHHDVTGPVERMMLIVGQNVQDSDGNGFPDTISVSAGLFTNPATIAVPGTGSFVFTLYRQGAVHDAGVAPVARWRIDGAALTVHERQKPWGIGYDFELSLLQQGGDRMSASACDLRGVYVTDDGRTIRSSDEVRPVQVGR